jgi:CDP-diacylglycerol--glycerol-3-phosphate 3-phosphatidyltransferase
MIQKVFFWAIPTWMTPNYFTYIRIMLVPVVYILLIKEEILLGLAVFFIAACTDFIDGALARKRDMVTDLGKILDPIADKLLIASVLAYFGFDYLVVQLVLAFIALEILGIIASTILAYRIGRPPGANVFGKIKMILQTAGVVLLFGGLILNSDRVIEASEITLAVALFFAIIAAYRQVAQKWNNLMGILGLKPEIKTIEKIIKEI